jgi:hypothetical protein
LSLCPVCGIASRKSCFDCEEQFCANHIYSCADCGNQYCGDCLDAHHADGHWADSDTALELASTQSTVRPLSLNSPDLRHSASTQSVGRASSAHWTDSDTAFKPAASRDVVRPSSVNSSDLRCSEPAASRDVIRPSSVNFPDLRRSELATPLSAVRSLSINPLDLRSSSLATGNQHRQASWSAILKSLLFKRLTHLATLIGCMFQSIALQSEVGL